MEESLSYREWLYWVAFHSLYDLPDGFLVTGQLGALVGNVAGNKMRPGDVAPYYAPPPGERSRSNLSSAFAFLKQHVPHKQRQPG